MSLSDPVEEEPITTESENEPAVEELNPSAEHPDQLAYTAAEEALAPEPNQQAESTVEPHTSEPAAEPGDSPLSTANIEQELSDTENRELLKIFLQLPLLNSEDLQEAAASPAAVEITPLLQERILNTIDMGGLLATINEWVAIPSLDGTPEEVAVQEKVAETMRANGLEVETWAFNYEELQDHPAFSVEVERPRGLGVVGILGHGPGRTLILNGHTDVVPAGDLAQWTVPPWQATVNRKEGRVYGRGALDMKGNLACAVYAAKAIKEAGIELNGRVLIQSVMGEEDGGVGTLAAVTRGYTADAAIVLEPTELMIAPAQAGALNFRVIIPGYPAHGAMRAEGVDPLEKFLLIYQAILTFEKVRNSHVDHPMFTAYELPYPICVGTIHGGNWASTVAESLTFEGRLGIAVDEKPAEARHKFEQLIAHAGQADPWLREHPPTVEWWGGQFAPAAIRTNHPIIKTLSNAFTQVTQQEPTLQGMPYGADMRLLVNEGNIPTVMFGAGDVRKAHQFDEHVPLDELETVVKTIALTIAHFCGIRSIS